MKDRDKREEMLSIYKPLILTEVSKYLRKLGNLADSMADDLEQAGSMGLLSALSSFDSSKSPVLIPYLRRGIDMAIMKELTDNLRTIRQPREVVKRARALKRAMNAKPDAGEEELMALSGLSASEMKSARLGLDAEAIVYIDAVPEAESFVPVQEGFEEEIVGGMMIDELKAAIDALESDDRYIIKAYSGAFGEEKRSLKQLARHFSYSLYLMQQRLEHILYAVRFDLEG